MAMFAGAGAMLLAVGALWWMIREPDVAPADVACAHVASSVLDQRQPAPRGQERIAVREVADDDVPLMSPGSTDNSESEPRHPHPITPAHERNFRHLNRIAQLNSAMDLGDANELRQMNRKYREEYPEASLYQEGYELIADCLDNRNAATRAAAERYWNTQVASNLRRYIRRYCLE